MENQAELSLFGEQLVSLWNEVCQELTVVSSPLLVNAWAKTSQLQKIESFSDHHKWLCTFNCPSSFNALQFEKNLGEQVKELLEHKLGRPTEIKFVFNQDSSFQLETKIKSSVKEDTSSQELKKQKVVKKESDFNRGLFEQAVVKKTLLSRAETIAKSLGLRPDYNFESFAVSSSNEMAHVAALSVANNPGISYNPLFLYGGVGVGKTHLMQAIGNHLLHKAPETRVIYCTGEEFTNSIIRAIQNKQALNFKDKFRNAQVLLIDDVQFIAGKTAVQEEFFHTFNALVKQSSQIVLTSDRPPQEIALLEERLRSRFEAGLKIDIQQPSFELRSAILLIKARSAKLDLPIELSQIIASRIDSARQLEGIIARLKIEVELNKKLLNQELVLSVLGDAYTPQNKFKRLQPQEIIVAVANHFSLKTAVIRGQKRHKEISQARHIAMFFLKTQLELSYSEIGKLFSNRDHTSVLHAVQKINDQIRKDEFFSREIETIKTSFIN